MKQLECSGQQVVILTLEIIVSSLLFIDEGRLGNRRLLVLSLLLLNLLMACGGILLLLHLLHVVRWLMTIVLICLPWQAAVLVWCSVCRRVVGWRLAALSRGVEILRRGRWLTCNVEWLAELSFFRAGLSSVSRRRV